MISANGRTIGAFIDDGYYISAYVEDYVNHGWLNWVPERGEVP